MIFNIYTVCCQVVNRYIDEGIAELVPGVLFIDEVSYYFILTNYDWKFSQWLILESEGINTNEGVFVCCQTYSGLSLWGSAILPCYFSTIWYKS